MSKGYEYFSKEDMQIANKQIKDDNILMQIREMQMKATMKYHLPFTTKVPFLKVWHQHTLVRIGALVPSLPVGCDLAPPL